MKTEVLKKAKKITRGGGVIPRMQRSKNKSRNQILGNSWKIKIIIKRDIVNMVQLKLV